MTRSPVRLEDAADELHRFVLANNGTSVSNTALLRSYDWLGLSDDTVQQLDRMYRRAYGGPGKVGAIAGVSEPAACAGPTPSPSLCGQEQLHACFASPHPDEIGVAITTPEVSLPPSPTFPNLTLQTTLVPTPPPIDGPRWPWQDADEDGDADADGTELPEALLTGGLDPWSESSIDNDLSTESVVLSPGPLVTRSGSLTPNAYSDISPMTSSKWGFLMGDSPLQGGRTVTVDT